MSGRYRSALVRVLVLTGFVLAGCDSAGIVDVEPETEVSPFFAFELNSFIYRKENW